MPIFDKSFLGCNFGCTYCYEHPIRPEDVEIDKEAVEKSIWEQYKKIYGDPPKKDKPLRHIRVGLHGGEPLFRGKKEVEFKLKTVFEKDRKTAIQTNGFLIDDDFIDMFKKYNTGVGVSIDGPWPCNEFRGYGTPEERKKQTEKVLENIYKLVENKIPVSVISVIHKKNGLGDRREILKNWIRELSSKRIHGRLNICMSGDMDIDLTPEEAVDFYSDVFNYLMKNGIRGWSPYKDISNIFLGNEEIVCIFKDCYPFYTPSCVTILKDGGVGVCLKNYMNDGKIYLRGEKGSNIRSKILKETDCKDCVWWEKCYGGCPAQAIDSDWRNKDKYCLMYKTLFRTIVNSFKSLGVPEPEKKKKEKKQRGGDYLDHYNAIEHLDGDTRYLDSDMRWGK